VVIERLSPANVTAFRQLRLRGLRESPLAFGSSYAEEAKLPRKVFVARLEQSPDKWIFGSLVGGRLVGVVTLIREAKRKERHKASIYGMYVERKMRRSGIGRQLIERVIEAARQLHGLKQVRLAVVETNRPALRLYKSVGFKLYGREAAALRIADKFYAELFLVCRL